MLRDIDGVNITIKWGKFVLKSCFMVIFVEFWRFLVNKYYIERCYCCKYEANICDIKIYLEIILNTRI